MSTDLIPIENPKVPQLYEKMQTAIVNCWAVDDCKQLVDQASAIAAYYKQIKDDRAVSQFLEIKLRAWRRIGEIVKQIDASGCDTQAAHCRKIREAIDDDVLWAMSDSTIYQALRLAEVPDDFFEDHVGAHRSVIYLINAYKEVQQEQWWASPEGQKEKARREEQEKAYDKRRRAEMAEREAAEAEERKKKKDDEEYIKDLLSARDDAFGEVGITMDRRDRKEMKEVMLLLKRPVHEVLRKAAFDKRITMQAILRAGLKMWFIAHDYDVSM